MNGLFIKNIIFCLLISYNVNTFCMDKSRWQLSKTFVLDEKGDKENKVNILKFNSCGKKLFFNLENESGLRIFFVAV